MVGLIGRYLQEVPVEKILIPRIYALDPAGKWCSELLENSQNLSFFYLQDLFSK